MGADVAESDVGLERFVGSMAASLKESRFGAQERKVAGTNFRRGACRVTVAAGGLVGRGSALRERREGERAGALSAQPQRSRRTDSPQRRDPQGPVEGLAKPAGRRGTKPGKNEKEGAGKLGFMSRARVAVTLQRQPAFGSRSGEHDGWAEASVSVGPSAAASALSSVPVCHAL